MAFTSEQAERLILSAARRGRLPHALLITGSQESGTYAGASFGEGPYRRKC